MLHWGKNCFRLHFHRPVLPDEQLVLLQKAITRHLQVVRCRTLADPARDVIVRPMARAKPATKVTGVGQGDATQVSADTDHNEPFGILDPSSVFLRVPKGTQVDTVGELDVLFGPAPDEHGLSTPLDCDSHPGLYARKVNLEGSKGKHILASRHAEDELKDQKADQGGIHEPSTRQDEVSKSALAGVTGCETLVVVLIVHNFRSWVLHSCHSGRKV